jgi:copper chaperone CopZ
MDNKFKILGIHCGACQKVIKKKLSKIDGVSRVNVEFNGNVLVSANRSINIDEMKLALEGTEYAVSQSS